MHGPRVPSRQIAVQDAWPHKCLSLLWRHHDLPSEQIGEARSSSLLHVVQVQQQRQHPRPAGLLVAVALDEVVVFLVLLPGKVLEDLQVFRVVERNAGDFCDFLVDPTKRDLLRKGTSIRSKNTYALTC